MHSTAHTHTHRPYHFEIGSFVFNSTPLYILYIFILDHESLHIAHAGLHMRAGDVVQFFLLLLKGKQTHKHTQNVYIIFYSKSIIYGYWSVLRVVIYPINYRKLSIYPYYTIYTLHNTLCMYSTYKE